jgi:hypothetical protein
LEQQTQRFIGDAVFGEIEQNIVKLPREFGEPLRVFGKQVAQVTAAHRVVMAL